MFKRIISASTAAVLSAAMVNAPAIVSYAATESTDTFFVNCGVSILETGNNGTALVPVSFDKDVTFSSATFEFSSGFNSALTFYYSEIVSAENVASGFTASCKDGIVTITAEKDITVKKGTNIFDLKLNIYDSNKSSKNLLKTINTNAFTYLRLTSFTAKNKSGDTFKLSSQALSNAYGGVQLIKQKVDSGSLTVGKVEASSKTVEVPVKLTAEAGTFIVEFKVTKNAKIKTINPDTSLGDFMISDYGCRTVFSSKEKSQDSDLGVNNVKFNDTQFCTVSVELPSDVKAGDTFEVIPVIVDMADGVKGLGSFYLPSVNSGSITYVGSDKSMKGDVNLDGKVNAEDGTLILKYFNYTSLVSIGMEGTDPIEAALKLNKANEGKDISELLNIALSNAKVTNDDVINSDDSTLVLKFFNEKSMNDAFGIEYTEEGIWDKLIIKK